MDASQVLKTRATLSALLSKNQNIGIIVRSDADLDTMAAGLSLYLSLKSSGKNVQIVCKTDPIVEIASLVGINKVKKNFEGDVQSISIVLPYKKVGVEKVSYFKDGDNLKVNLIGGQNKLHIDDGDIEIVKNGSGPTLLFCIGLASQNALEHFGKDPATKIVNIDRNANNSRYGDVVLVDPQFSSNSEIVAKMLKDFAFPIDQDIAQNLLDGILFATDNFRSEQTSSTAFEATGLLMRKGAQRRKVQMGSNKKEQNIERIVKNDEEIVLEEKKIQEPKKENPKTEKIPSDWFMPKVYKGSKKHN